MLIWRRIRQTLGSVRLSARSARVALSQSSAVAAPTAAGRSQSVPLASVEPWKETQHQQFAFSNPVAALQRADGSSKPTPSARPDSSVGESPLRVEAVVGPAKADILRQIYTLPIRPKAPMLRVGKHRCEAFNDGVTQA
jgi:hypothetical protein